MTLHSFWLLIDRLPTEGEVELIFAHHDDLGVEESREAGTTRISVDRDAPSLLDAALSAIRDLDAVGLRPVGALVDDMVAVEDIADRVGRSPDAVRLWMSGKAGPGRFPPPVNPESSTAFYSWASVVPWLRGWTKIEVVDEAPVLAALDLALRLRAIAPRVDRMGAVRDLIPYESAG